MTSGIRPPEISGRRDPPGRTGHQGETEARCEQAGARLAALVEVTEGGEERGGGSGCCGHVLHPFVRHSA